MIRNKPSNHTRAKVFFDGGCPLCRREIAHYQRIDKAGLIEWIDITSEPDKLIQHDLDAQDAMARLHVLDLSGQWQTGAPGFAEMWAHLPGYRWLSKFIRITHLVPAMDWLYTRFARARLQRRCSTDRCSS